MKAPQRIRLQGLHWAADYDCKRVRLIQVYKSSDVNLEGLTLERSGSGLSTFAIRTKVHVDGITIHNNIGGRGPSTDGIDIDSSSNILIERCDIDCNDDALCLNAGRDADGLRVNRSTKDVIIRNCTIRGGAAGITAGSETSGGIRNVRYPACMFLLLYRGEFIQISENARWHRREDRYRRSAA